MSTVTERPVTSDGRGSLDLSSLCSDVDSVDGDTLEDGTVTLRDRDSMEQIRVPAEKVGGVVLERMGAWTPGD